MELQTIKKYINDPAKLDENTLQPIQELVAKYPWFHTAHILLLLNLKNINSQQFDAQLKRSSAHVNNRKRLFQMITDMEDTVPAEDEVKTEDRAKMQDQVIEEDDQETVQKSTSDKMQSNISKRLSFEQEQADDNTEKDINDVMQPSVESVADPGFHERDEETFTIDNQGKITQKKEGKDEDSKKKSPADNDLLDFEYNLEDIIDNTDQTPTVQKSKKDKLIEKFIKEEPRINQHAPKATDKDQSTDSVKENNELFTETLANIYIKQENYSKAIYIYKQLSLKYPQKSAYFANQIEKIKKNLK